MIPCGRKEPPPSVHAINRVRDIADGTGINDNIILLVRRNAYAKSNTAVTRAVLRGIERANREVLLAQDAGTMLAPMFGLSPEVTNRTLKRYTFKQRLSPDLVRQLEKSASFMLRNKMVRRPVAVGEFIEDDLPALTALNHSGSNLLTFITSTTINFE